MSESERNTSDHGDNKKVQEEFSRFCKQHSLRLVADAYRGILGREPDGKGLEHYAAALNGSDDFVTLMRTLVASAEHRAKIVKAAGLADVDGKDIFNGILVGDRDRVGAICDPDREVVPSVFVDPIGVRVSPQYYPWIATRVGTRHSDIPIPNDTYFAEGIEYVALALALERAKGNRQFTVVEIGAGWGPWVSASAIVARRQGFESINLVAFEADEERFRAMRAHLDLNGIVPKDASPEGTANGVNWKLLNVVADTQEKSRYWPIAGGIQDAGLVAVSTPGRRTDYRGKTMSYKEIPARDIRESLDSYPTIDFMHIDIQGGECDLIQNSLDFLEERVRTLFVGTHNRKIEGDLIAGLRERGWVLLRERPCQFDLSSRAPTLTGTTYVDGGQLWRAPAK